MTNLINTLLKFKLPPHNTNLLPSISIFKNLLTKPNRSLKHIFGMKTKNCKAKKGLLNCIFNIVLRLDFHYIVRFITAFKTLFCVGLLKLCVISIALKD